MKSIFISIMYTFICLFVICWGTICDLRLLHSMRDWALETEINRDSNPGANLGNINSGCYLVTLTSVNYSLYIIYLFSWCLFSISIGLYKTFYIIYSIHVSFLYIHRFLFYGIFFYIFIGFYKRHIYIYGL